jgi:hypothetical protein
MIECKICHKILPKSIGNHLKEHKSVISVKEYYDLYLNPSSEIKICENPRCDKETPFRNIAGGYDKYCSQNCSRSHQNLIEWQNPDYIKTHSEISRKTMNNFWKDENFRKRKLESDKLSKPLREKNAWLTHCKDYTHGFLYLGINSVNFKVGVSRSLIKNGIPDLNYVHARIAKSGAESFELYFGEITEVAEAEYFIKSNFEQISSEIFDISKLTEIKSVLHNFKINKYNP